MAQCITHGRCSGVVMWHSVSLMGALRELWITVYHLWALYWSCRESQCTTHGHCMGVTVFHPWALYRSCRESQCTTHGRCTGVIGSHSVPPMGAVPKLSGVAVYHPWALYGSCPESQCTKYRDTVHLRPRGTVDPSYSYAVWTSFFPARCASFHIISSRLLPLFLCLI